MSDGDFLSRWSRRKHEARRGEPVPEAPRIETEEARPPIAAAKPVDASPTIEAPPVPLPPVESLTLESDFAPFMQADVDSNVRRAALKTLFGDPRFNVMDGLDVYIDDYSKPDPLPEGWLEKLNQVAYLGHYQPPAEPESAPAVVADPPPPIEPPLSPECEDDVIHMKPAQPASGENPGS